MLYTLHNISEDDMNEFRWLAVTKPGLSRAVRQSCDISAEYSELARVDLLTHAEQ